MTEADVPDAWVRFLRAHALLVQRLSASLESGHGLALGEYEILIALQDAPQHRLRRVDLARRLLISQSGVTRRLQGLERRDLVGKERCTDDQRVHYATLTDAGLRLVRGARATHRRDIAAEFSAHFTPRQLDQLGDLLGRLPGVVAADWAPLDA